MWSSTWRWYKGSFGESFAWGRKRKEEAKKEEAQLKLDALQGMVRDAREATHNTPEVSESVGVWVRKRSHVSRKRRSHVSRLMCLKSSSDVIIPSEAMLQISGVLPTVSHGAVVACHVFGASVSWFRTERSNRRKPKLDVAGQKLLPCSCLPFSFF